MREQTPFQKRATFANSAPGLPQQPQTFANSAPRSQHHDHRQQQNNHQHSHQHHTHHQQQNRQQHYQQYRYQPHHSYQRPQQFFHHNPMFHQSQETVYVMNAMKQLSQRCDEQKKQFYLRKCK